MPEQEARTQGVEFGRFGKVDVTSDAQRNLIIPTLRQIMAVDSEAEMTSEERCDGIISPIGERIALPIWGQRLTKLIYPPREVQSEFKVVALPRPVRDSRLHNHFVSGDIPTLINPHITDSLLISDNVTLGIHGGSNPTSFTADHIVAMAKLGQILQQKDWHGIQQSLEEIEGGLLDDYTVMYSGGLTHEDMQLYGKFGDRALTGKIVDKYWFPALQNGASGDFVDNSILYGSSVARYVNGGTIQNSIVVAKSRSRNFSHMHLDNVYFITEDGVDDYFPPGGQVGEPESAEKAVALARGFSEHPLADFATKNRA